MKPPFRIGPAVEAHEDELRSIRRTIHAHPEIAFTEKATGALVAKRLKRAGLKVKTGVAKTGVVGLLRGAHPGPTILVRADMDCLPLQEENRKPYVSKRANLMHACGHDGHVAMATVTAEILSRQRGDLHGNIKFVFQPAEESPGGARPMIEEGVMENPHVDAAVGIHLWNDFPVGRLGIRSGPLLACADIIEIDVFGPGGHGAAPHQTVDTILVASQIVNALQQISSRNISPLEPVVVSICSIHAGHAHNIIPRRVQMVGTVRTFNRARRDELPKRIEDIIRGVTGAAGARYGFRYRKLYPATINDPRMTAFVKQCALDIVAKEQIDETVQTLGGEDMSFFLEKAPGCFIFVGSNNKAKDLAHPHHNPRFDFDESALKVGAELFSRVLTRFLDGRPNPLENPEARKTIVGRSACEP
ncbi:MAG: amidohydrolase [Planctomycetes bacterium]|nr:amidohydrolase [Planctomycetota bacterium]